MKIDYHTRAVENGLFTLRITGEAVTDVGFIKNNESVIKKLKFSQKKTHFGPISLEPAFPRDPDISN